MPSRLIRHLLFLPLIGPALVPFPSLARTPASSIVFLGTLPVMVSTVPVADSDVSSFSIDGAENYYYADTSAGTVVVVNNGQLTTSATGLKDPKVQVDFRGNVYIADTGNDRILRIAAGSVAEHVISRLPAPQAIAVDASGAIFTLSRGHLVQLGRDGHFIDLAEIPGAAFLATGPTIRGNSTLYILSKKGSAYSTFVYTYSGGTGSIRKLVSDSFEANITGFAVDNASDLLVSETTASGSTVLSVTEGGFKNVLAAGASTATPLAVDGNRNVYFLAAAGVEKIELGAVNLGSAPIGAIYTTTNPSPATAELTFGIPPGVVVNSVVSSIPSFTAQFTNGSGCIAGAQTCSITVWYYSNYEITGLHSGVVWLQDEAGNTLATVPLYVTATGSGLGSFEENENAYYYVTAPYLKKPSSLAISPEEPSGVMYATDDALGELLRIVGFSGPPEVVRSGLSQPTAVAINGEDDAFVAQWGTDGILRINNDGSESQLAPAIHHASGLATDSAGNLYIAAQNDIYKISLDGSFSTFADPGTDGNYQFVYSVTVGGDGNLYAGFGGGGETGTGGIVQFTQDGKATRLPVGVSRPSGIAVDPAGNIYLVDVLAKKLIVFYKDGRQMTVSTDLKSPVALTLYKANPIVVDSEAPAILYTGSAARGSFGAVTIGTTATLTSVLSSTGTEPLTATIYYAYPHHDYKLLSPGTTLSLDPGMTTDLTMSYSPTTPGSSYTEIVLNTNVAAPISVPVAYFYSGAGVEP